jgi:hypothetical protein
MRKYKYKIFKRITYNCPYVSHRYPQTSTNVYASSQKSELRVRMLKSTDWQTLETMHGHLPYTSHCHLRGRPLSIRPYRALNNLSDTGVKRRVN